LKIETSANTFSETEDRIFADFLGSGENMTNIFLTHGIQEGETKELSVIPSSELGQLRFLHLYTDGGDGWQLKSMAVKKKGFPLYSTEVNKWISASRNSVAWVPGSSLLFLFILTLLFRRYLNTN